MYEVRITPEGFRHLNRIPPKVREAALHGPISESPRQLGNALVGDLAGLRSARRGDYWIIYGLDDTIRTVTVHRIQHRGSVYRPR